MCLPYSAYSIVFSRTQHACAYHTQLTQLCSAVLSMHVLNACAYLTQLTQLCLSCTQHACCCLFGLLNCAKTYSACAPNTSLAQLYNNKHVAFHVCKYESPFICWNIPYKTCNSYSVCISSTRVKNLSPRGKAGFGWGDETQFGTTLIFLVNSRHCQSSFNKSNIYIYVYTGFTLPLIRNFLESILLVLYTCQINLMIILHWSYSSYFEF